MTLHPVPAFNDNYIWVLHNERSAVVVDPGEAAGVTRYLEQAGLTLDTILVTHHHPDHVGGVAELRDRTGARVVGPAHERLPEPVQRVQEGDTVEALGCHFKVIDVPGHTAGHIAFFSPDIDGQPLLFCGDTLFSAGCGRLFEGTPAQMHDSLSRLAALPGETRVCCTHEYTLSNLRFALTVEPDNAALQAYAERCRNLRERNLPTLPSSIQLERAINPFLRAHLPSVALGARQHQPPASDDPVAVLTALRAWKDVF